MLYKIKQIPKIDILYSLYLRKNKKTTESVIFRLYSKDIVIPCSFLNIRNARCLFSAFVSFCISLSCLLVVVSSVCYVTLLDYVIQTLQHHIQSDLGPVV